VRRLRRRLCLDGWGTSIFPRQGVKKRAKALQALQTGQKRASRRNSSCPILRGSPANRGFGAMCPVWAANNRSFLSVSRTPGLLPFVFSRRARFGFKLTIRVRFYTNLLRALSGGALDLFPLVSEPHELPAQYHLLRKRCTSVNS
jgi:hypothetical protein